MPGPAHRRVAHSHREAQSGSRPFLSTARLLAAWTVDARGQLVSAFARPLAASLLRQGLLEIALSPPISCLRSWAVETKQQALSQRNGTRDCRGSVGPVHPRSHPDALSVGVLTVLLCQAGSV